jgi:phosphatidylglycerol---prolipoprotein diacylglyceryl transferase
VNGTLCAVTDAFLATIPSPTQGVWYLGPLPLRAYALCILVGIVAACVITELRLRQRGAPKWLVLDIAIWAVPFGLVGGRLYHVITSPDAYFGAGGNPMKAFAIWEGGLGIWGAVALGAVGAWIACRRMGLPLTFFADAIAPALPVAQAIGRLGNWFNNELYGGPTSLPWGLKVYDYDLSTGKALTDANGNPIELTGGPFHPTFLYELVWDLGVALLVYLVDKRWKLGRGRAFALYVMAYTVGRFWIEALRIDPAHGFAGLRVNNWVSIVVFLGALLYFVMVKGPQEHVRLNEDGTLTLVSPDGAPIEGRRLPAPRAAVSTKDTKDIKDTKGAKDTKDTKGTKGTKDTKDKDDAPPPSTKDKTEPAEAEKK